MSGRDLVVHVLPDKLGGISTAVRAWLDSEQRATRRTVIVRTRDRLSEDATCAAPIGGDEEYVFAHDGPLENLYAVAARLRRLVPRGPGVLVAHDLLPLAMLGFADPGLAVVNVLHGDHDYYYRLAARHEPVVDTFVAVSDRIGSELGRRVPAAADRIERVPLGVGAAPSVRRPSRAPLRVAYVGRLHDASKGVMLLPQIASRVAAAGVVLRWTVIGDGPDAARLRRAWPESVAVEMTGGLPRDHAWTRLAEHDLLVLPTHGEGFPVTLLESLAAGVVPLVTDLAGGVREILGDGRHGVAVRPRTAETFADAICALHADRERLRAMAERGVDVIAASFSARASARAFESALERARSRYDGAPRRAPRPYGSRLDRAWLPNPVVRGLRGARRRLAGWRA